MQEHERSPACATLTPLDLCHVCLREGPILSSVRTLLLPCLQALLLQGMQEDLRAATGAIEGLALHALPRRA